MYNLNKRSIVQMNIQKKICSYRIIQLSINEAEALYMLNKNEECQNAKYNKKSVWWAKKNFNNEIEHIICQYCYHNNDAIYLKSEYTPILMLDSVHYCYRSLIKENKSINIYEDWSLEIIGNKKILSAEYNFVSNKRKIRVTYRNVCNIELSFYIKGIHVNQNIIAEIYDNDVVYQPKYVVKNIDSNQKNVILEGGNEKGIYPFFFNTNNTKEKTIQIILYSGNKIPGEVTVYKLLFTIDLTLCPEYCMHDVGNIETVYI